MKKQSRALVSVFAFSILGAFALWWFRPDHIPNNFIGWAHVLDYILFSGLSYVVLLPMCLGAVSWAITKHIKNHEPPHPAAGMRVAIITRIISGADSAEQLRQSLRAMTAVDYEHDTWLVHESHDFALRQLCQDLGVMHFSSNSTRSWDTAIGQNYDIVAYVEPGVVLAPSFLMRTVGYFENSKVASVVIPQVYSNTSKSMIARGDAEHSYRFFGSMLRGLYGLGATPEVGASHINRVGTSGDASESIYVYERLAIGVGPVTWKGYLERQLHFAYAAIETVFQPSMFRGRQKFYYFFVQQYYLSGGTLPVIMLGLGLYFILGLNPANLQTETFAAMYSLALTTCLFLFLQLQRYNAKLSEESTLMLTGRFMSLATWPIYFLALIRFILRQPPKATIDRQNLLTSSSRHPVEFKVFRLHLFIGVTCSLMIVFGLLRGHDSWIMIALALCVAGMLSLPFSMLSYAAIQGVIHFFHKSTRYVLDLNKFYELNTSDKGLLPSRVTNEEKYSYARRRHNGLLMTLAFVSFTATVISASRFLLQNPYLFGLIAYLVLSIIHYGISAVVNAFTKDFDLEAHQRLVRRWRPLSYPSVDVFLPTAGEPIAVLRNTWEGVVEATRSYRGKKRIYCLDDAASDEVKAMAEEFGFQYEVRSNRGEFKKAGNLRHGFKISKGDLIAIFDADFRPRHDFFNELAPYFSLDTRIGIVQSPQYFGVSSQQNWLERGAGAVQELFYRYSQVSRQNFEAAICVGSNAIYRRAALNDIGGTALIEHSEDVHTGFNLRMAGWKLSYVPIILAKGLCPSSMNAFFKQQYRWCRGSMSLLSSRKFWSTKMSWRARSSYMSGFSYYIHTAISSFVAPMIPLIVLAGFHEQITPVSVLLVLPSLFFAQVVFPLWHGSTYGIEAWSTRTVYGWAHLFAVADAITNRSMAWRPTGAKMSADNRYIAFRTFQFLFNFIPALVWVGLSAHYISTERDYWLYIPVLLSGLYFLSVTLKVALYHNTKQAPQPAALGFKATITTHTSSKSSYPEVTRGALRSGS